MKPLSWWLCGLLVVLLVGIFDFASGQRGVEEYYDAEYGYSFKYPSGWHVQNMAEGGDNKDIRVMLRGPNGSSFMVVVEKAEKVLTKTVFEDEPARIRRVSEMIQQTIAQVYQAISENIRAVKMTIGERRDLSNDVGIKFYIATLHTMKNGKPIIVAGIHSFPFSKDYAINFTMTAFWDSNATKENETLTTVFNSFHLLGEPSPGEGVAKPSAGAADKSESK